MKYLIGLLFLALTACDSGPSASLIGSFGPTTCFLNKEATKGFGANVYTIASLSFNADGTGTNSFALYTDDECLVPALDNGVPIEGKLSTTYTIVRQANLAVQIVHVVQLDNGEFYLPIAVSRKGLFVDVNYEAGASGPYSSPPSDLEIESFLNNPVNADSSVFVPRK